MNSMLMRKTLLLVLATLPFAGEAHAAKCKFEMQEAEHVESRRVVLFRAMAIGLLGYLGQKNGEYYLRGVFGSNFKGRVLFTTDTPLELTLADGRTLTLDVVTEEMSSGLHFGHILLVTRDAHPVFTVTPEQWNALRETPIVNLRMSFELKEERQTEDREVKGKHAQKIMAAIACVDRESGPVAGAVPTSEATD